MSYFLKDLYNTVIDNNAKSSNCLKIISGYGSALFLEKVLKDYPHLKIELYLGMTVEGISKSNHIGFQNLMKSFSDRVAIYYQVERPLTHMKLYCWYYESINIKNYAGSANFTDNGFFNNIEILIDFDESTESLLETQKEKSLTCIDKKIEEYIFIFEEDKDEIEETTQKYKGNSYDVIIDDDELSEGKKSRNFYGWRQQFLKYKQRVNKDYERFEIPIVLETDISFSTRGINAWNIRKQTPYLMQSPKYQFSKVFPLDTFFTFYTDDGYEFEGIVRSNRDTQLEITPNLYTYISKRIGVQNNTPISFSDLCKYGRTKAEIYKLTDKDYVFNFGVETDKFPIYNGKIDF